MKLNWFSPLPPAKTEIAYHTVRILRALRGRAEVHAWTEQSEWEPVLNGQIEVHSYHPERVLWEALNGADMNVYNIGNNVLFHDAIWQVSRRQSGIVVLHDMRLQHLFAGWYQQRQDRKGFLYQMARFYGPAGQQAAEKFWGGLLSTEDLAQQFPLTPLAIENALGVLVHTREAFEELRRENQLPVAYVPLPYAATPRPRANRIPSAASRCRLIIFGYIGPNRRLDSVLRALAQFPARDRFRLDVYGRLWDRSYIQKQIDSLQLSELVRLHSFVADDALEKALEAAHLAINLRFPTMGEASASQLRIWDHALPSLVTQIGWYATLPENVVAFVRPHYEVVDIQAQLSAFLANPARFAQMGENGRRLLEESHSPEMYAQAMVDFLERVLLFRKTAMGLRLAQRAAREMRYWLNSRVSREVCDQLAGTIHGMVA